MRTADRIEVCLDGKRVGTLAPYKRYLTAFEYSEEWLKNGFSISPFSLPLEPGVKISKAEPFEGMFGIFYDSLPDGWGRLLVDRMLRKEGTDPVDIDQFSRLSIVGTSGMGALEYKPVFELSSETQYSDLDRIAEECKKILDSKESSDLDLLFALGGSSGGARPKALIKDDDGEWIVKFPTSYDSEEVGLMEYEYTLCAKKCGIRIPDVKLFHSDNCPGYFGSKRFDRTFSNGGVKKVHMASASALLEVSHRIPALDYTSLMGLTWQLTKSTSEVIRMYKLMCFNVFAHNRDDHSNNFSFICNEGNWAISPAYDLTYSSSLGGEHATTVAGEGKDPKLDDILNVANYAGIKEKEARDIALEIKDIVGRDLKKYL